MRWKEYVKVPGVLCRSPPVSVWHPKIHYVSLLLKLFCPLIFHKWTPPRETLLDWCPPVAISRKISDSENIVCDRTSMKTPCKNLKTMTIIEIEIKKILTISCSNPVNISPWSCSNRSRCCIQSTIATLFLWSYLNFREFKEWNFETFELNGDLNENDASSSKGFTVHVWVIAMSLIYL